MQRPTAVTVFGILNIVFAALGFLGAIGSFFTMFIMPNTANNPVLKIVHEQPVMYWWTLSALVAGLALSALLLIAGIGLLKMKPSGRVMSVYYSIANLVLGVASLLVNGVFLISPLLAEAGKSSGPEAAGAVGGVIGGVCGGSCALVYPIVLLIFMTRPKLVAAFNPPAPPPLPPPVA